MANKPEFTRPFNAVHAKAGAPYGCADGSKPDILKWAEYQIFGTVTDSGDVEFPAAWAMDGEMRSGVLDGRNKLVMLPLGFVQGKPFFVGDQIIGSDGSTFIAEPRDVDSAHEYFRWPAPAKVYPTTNMNFDAMLIVYLQHQDDKSNGFARSLRAVANAALRHAVDAGQVITKADHEAALFRLGDQLRDVEIKRAAGRDMAVAIAVLHECASRCMRTEGFTKMALTLGDIDITALIAGVK